MTTPDSPPPGQPHAHHHGCGCSHAKTPSEAFSRIWPMPLVIVGVYVIGWGFAEKSVLQVLGGTLLLWLFSEIRKGQKAAKGEVS